jgi:molybdopterin-guanine dinucleotide biosynthesis protein A
MDHQPSVTGVVLAGGEGKRFGEPKADLLFLDEPLIARVVRNLSAVADHIVVVAAPTQDIDLAHVNGVRLLRDEASQRGPLAGLHQALRTLETGVAVAVACDMPFLDPTVIRHQINLLGTHQASIPVVDGRAQPLHGVYTVECVNVSYELLRQGARSLHALLDALDVRFLDEREWQPLSPTGSTFFNINTAHDMVEALGLAERLPR